MWTLVLVVGCVSVFRPSTKGTLKLPRTAESDTSIAAVVLRSVTDSTQGRVRVDPLPLPHEMDLVSGSAVPTSVQMRADSGMLRLRALTAIAVRAASDSIREHCAGVLAPDIEGRKSGCPQAPQTIVVMGSPAYLPRSRADSLSTKLFVHLDPQARVMRALISEFSRAGRVTTLYDYVVVPLHGHWSVLLRIPLLIME